MLKLALTLLYIEFILKFRAGFKKSLKFASCAGFKNALEMLRAQDELALHEDDQVLAGGFLVNASMSINSLLACYPGSFSIIGAIGTSVICVHTRGVADP